MERCLLVVIVISADSTARVTFEPVLDFLTVWIFAGQIFGLPIMGTHAHSFVTTFRPEDIEDESFNPCRNHFTLTSTESGLNCNEGHLFKERCIEMRRFVWGI